MNGGGIRDPRNLTFSQAYGYEELPQPLKLEELSEEARTRLWSLLYRNVHATRMVGTFGASHVGVTWASILEVIHEDVLGRPADEFETEFDDFCRTFKHNITYYPFSLVFDLLLAIMRHPECPEGFARSVAMIFERCRMAYVVDLGPPPTIFPAAIRQEGEAVLRAIGELSDAGLLGAERHLRQASDCINRGDYPGAVRESIHAVESTARQIDPNARTLDPALKTLERAGALHPALKQAFSNLYGYSSDEQGIRHALIDNPQPNVGQDEAVFMLGACASFSSYLARKHRLPAR